MSLTQLNTQQNATFDAFIQFMMSTDTFFAITGPAGTGKTFLMNTLSEDGLKYYYDACKLVGIEPQFHSTAFCATTNKAAEVLSLSIGKPVQTVHSFLGLKVTENFKTGKTFVEKNRNWHPISPIVLFIDECSMIDTELFDLIMETVPTSKIVFVGDHAQMAPIAEDLSPVYSTVPLQNFASLTEPVRNADSPALMALCQQLRDTVETGIFNPIHAVPGTIDYLDSDSMPQELHTTFTDLNPSSRVLAYTNARVQEYNDFIRADVRSRPPELCVGDVVVVAQTYQRGRISLAVEEEVLVSAMSDQLEDETLVDLLDGHCLPYKEIDLQTPDGTDRAEKIRLCLRRDVLDWVLKELAKKKEWRRFYDLKGTYIDLRHKSACTVYKSQGSTYDSVYVDLGNIGTSFDAQQVARMLYVAVSRARHRVCFYGRLPSRYHNSNGEPLWITTSGPTASSVSSGSAMNAA